MKKYKKEMRVLIIRNSNDLYLFYNYEFFKINETGARIIELCDGKNSKIDIIRKISKKFNINEYNIENDVNYYIDLLLSLKIIFEV